MTLNRLVDVRTQMPNYENYKNQFRTGEILGIAIHHSATADRQTGEPTGDAFSFFNYHVNGRGWDHGGYNYVIPFEGAIQYALDERISAYHAGFKDPDNSQGLEQGQYWNNHYLAICVSGWFSNNRSWQDEAGTHPIPNNFTHPTQAQTESLMSLIEHLAEKYHIPVENIRAHRELTGNSTQCPGLNLDPAQIRAKLRETVEPPPVLPNPLPGEHVILLPDTQDYLSAALGYIWKFRPDVSFASQAGVGRWRYIIAVGGIDSGTLAEYRQHGAILVQHIEGNPDAVRQQLDQLVAQNQPFLSVTTQDPQEPEEPEPPQEPVVYVVQPGDTLSKIAKQVYGQASLWTIIFEANRDILSDPARIRVGQALKIPPRN